MTIDQRIVIIDVDGSERELKNVPSLQEMQAIVGGYIEHVTVLDRIDRGQPIYTSMYVNEEGLINELPRNARATELYQRNARFQYPDTANPFIAMDESARESLGNASIIDLRPQEYIDDPWIAGTVIYFKGWTVKAVDVALEGRVSGVEDED